MILDIQYSIKMNKFKKFFDKHEKIISVSMFCFIVLWRYLVMVNTPVWSALSQPYDDSLYFSGSRNLILGSWLGSYSTQTLIKGLSIYFYYAFMYFMHIPFMTGIFFLYLFSSMQLAISVRHLINSKLVRFLVFAIFFCVPYTVSSSITTKMQRMSIVIPCTVFLLASIMGIYTRIEYPIKKQIVWFVSTGFWLAFYWLLREEALLVLPLIIGCFVVYAIRTIIRFQDISQRLRIFLWLIPVLFVVTYISQICSMNQKYYGIYAVSDRTDTNFNRAIGFLTSVQADPGLPENVIVSVAMRDLALENSETLSRFSEPLFETWSAWSEMRGRTDGEVNGDDFVWVLRSTAKQCGYYVDGQSTNEMWGAVADELEKSFADGSLKRIEGITLSNLFNPLKSDDIQRHLQSALKGIMALSEYPGSMNPAWTPHRNDETTLAESLSFSNYIYSDKGTIQVTNPKLIEGLTNMNAVLAKPYQLSGKLALLISLAFNIFGLCWCITKRNNYLGWELLCVTAGFGLTAIVMAFGICIFTSCWGGGTYYLTPVLPVLQCYEMFSVLLAYHCSKMESAEKREPAMPGKKRE